MAWRSGSPHGVVGAVHASAACRQPVKMVVSQLSWPRATRMEAPTSTSASAPNEILSRRLIGLPPLDCHPGMKPTPNSQRPATDYRLPATSYVVGFFVN